MRGIPAPPCRRTSRCVLIRERLMHMLQVIRNILIVAVLFFAPAGPAVVPESFAVSGYTSGVERLPQSVLTPEIWLFYPSLAPATNTRFGNREMKVAVSAPVAEGVHPVVVISHGLFGQPADHHRLAEDLARSGFIVIAPVHADGPALAQRYTRRTRDISISLDTVLADPRFAHHLDASRIGAFGFSLGGASVLAAAGGRINLDLLRTHCHRAIEDPVFCSSLGVGNLAGSVPLFPDRRLRSIVLAAPVGVVFSSLDAVTADVWVIRAGEDKELRFPFHAERVRNLMRRPYRYSFEPSAHHFAFLSPFPASLADQIGAPARDPAGFDRTEFQNRINREITAHFKNSLRP